MKRICTVLFALAMLLGLCGCGAQQKVKTPLTWERIDAIPVASADMTTRQLRQICVDYFRLQLTFQWVMEEDLDFLVPTYEQTSQYKADTVYAGLPYITPSNSGNLYIIMDHYDPQTGVITKDPQMSDQEFARHIGNHCTSGASWAWARVVNSMSTFTNRLMCQSMGFLSVGPYTYENVYEWNESYNTFSVCAENTDAVMYESYAQVQMADGLYMYKKDGGISHCRMAAQDAVVVRNSDGTVDPEESYILYLDQGRTFDTRTMDDGSTATVVGGVDKKATFAQLFQKGYIPFTFGELIGTDPVEASNVTLLMPNGEAPADAVSAVELMRGTVKANYLISNMRLTLTDASGKTVYTNNYYAPRNETWEVSMAALVFPTALESFAQQDYTVTVTCRIGTGENVTLYQGILQ